MLVRRLRTASLVAVLLLVLAACGGEEIDGAETGGDGAEEAAGDGELTTIRIAHNSNAANLSAQVADEQGFFADHGLQAEFTIVENIATVPAAMGQSFDIAQATATSLLTASAEGIEVVQVASATMDTEDNPTASVIVGADSGITSVEQLEGATLGGLTENGTLHIATQKWMQDSGVDLDTVEFVQVDGPNHADQLGAGRIDAVESVAPFSSTVLELEGVENLGDPYLEMAEELSALVFIANTDWAQDNTEVIEDYIAALNDAITFIGENEAEAIEILQGYSNLSDEVAESLVLPTYVAEPRPQDLEVWYEALQQVQGFDAELDVDSLVIDVTGG